MPLEQQDCSNNIKREPIITNDEVKFIDASGQPPLYVYGILTTIRRTGQTLAEVSGQAISEPGNKEHIPDVLKARDFLAKNSERFGLIIPPDKSI